MRRYDYTKISRIQLSCSSSGMMLGSNKSFTEEVIWEKDGRVVLVRTVIEGFLREVSTWKMTPEMAEKIRQTAERADMASWGDLKYEEDPRFRCTDVSSSARGSIILDSRHLGGKPYEIVNFDQRAVASAGKGEDLKAMEDLFRRIADQNMCESVEQTETNRSESPITNAFLGMTMRVPAKNEISGWTCKCGTDNAGKFCTECGKPRP